MINQEWLPRMFFLILFFVLLSSCDPAVNIFINNGSQEELILKTNPTLESLYGDGERRKSIINNYKINQIGDVGVYRIKPQATFLFYSHMGFEPEQKRVPFSYIELVSIRDTIKLNSKEEILRKIKEIGIKGSKRNFYLNFPLKN